MRVEDIKDDALRLFLELLDAAKEAVKWKDIDHPPLRQAISALDQYENKYWEQLITAKMERA